MPTSAQPRNNNKHQSIEFQSLPFLIYLGMFFIVVWLWDSVLWLCKLNWSELCKNIWELRIKGREFINLQELLEWFFRFFRPFFSSIIMIRISTKFDDIKKWSNSCKVLCFVFLMVVIFWLCKFISFSNEDKDNMNNDDHTIADQPVIIK